MKLSFYTVESAYCDFLREGDKNIPYNAEKKTSRPFIGIVFSIHEFFYYAPLSSPKKKHLSMKNQIDFIKINHGEWELLILII